MKQIQVFFIGLLIGVSCVVPIAVFTIRRIQADVYGKDVGPSTGFPPEEIGYINEILEIVEFDNTTESIHRLRGFVYENSVHSPSGEVSDSYRNVTYILYRLIETYKTGNPPLPLICGPRAWAMIRVLEYAGVKVREVHTYGDGFDGVMGHIFLEFFDPETRQWMVQDPDFNVYYVSKSSGEKLSVLQLVFGNLDDVIPVSTDTFGWVETNTEVLRENYFESVLYHRELGELINILLINSDRFEVNKRFLDNDNMNIFEVADESLLHPKIIVSRGW